MTVMWQDGACRAQALLGVFGLLSSYDHTRLLSP